MPAESTRDNHARKKEKKRKKHKESQKFSTPPPPAPSSSGYGEEGKSDDGGGSGLRNERIGRYHVFPAEEEKNRSPVDKERMRGKTKQAWVRREDDIVLRNLCKAGERSVDWNAVLCEINKDRDVERSMASLRLHWANTLRNRIMKISKDHETTSPRQAKTLSGFSSTERTPIKKRTGQTRADDSVKRYADESDEDEF